jgi:hypothetical protein
MPTSWVSTAVLLIVWRYRIGTMDRYRDNDPAGTTSAVRVEDWRDVKLAGDADADAVITQTGDIWRQWGWRVIERDGFEKPNRFGYTPNVYVMHREARSNGSPLLIGSSPCYPNGLHADTHETRP